MITPSLRTLICLSAIQFSIGQCAAEYHDPPGAHHTSWVGNSFPGDGGPSGFGYWVQNGADEIEVTPDGTVIAGTDWDEAGRCAGLYKDGLVNRVLLKHETDTDPNEMTNVIAQHPKQAKELARQLDAIQGAAAKPAQARQ